MCGRRWCSASRHNLSGELAQWLEKEANATKLSREIGIIAPRVLQFFRHHAVEDFVQRNIVEWIKASESNLLTAQMLQAIFNNGNHQQAFQFFLEQLDDWLTKNPQQAQELLAPFIDAIIGSVLSKVRSSFSNDSQGVASLIVGGLLLLPNPKYENLPIS